VTKTFFFKFLPTPNVDFTENQRSALAKTRKKRLMVQKKRILLNFTYIRILVAYPWTIEDSFFKFELLLVLLSFTNYSSYRKILSHTYSTNMWLSIFAKKKIDFLIQNKENVPLRGSRHSLLTARFVTPDAVFRTATRATPSPPNRSSIALARGHFMGGKFSSLTRTKSSTTRPGFGVRHLERCCSNVKYSSFHRDQKICCK